MVAPPPGRPPGRPPGTSTRTSFTTNEPHSINNTFNNTTLETEYKANQAYQRLVGLFEDIKSILVSNAKHLRTPMITESYKKDHKNIPHKKQKTIVTPPPTTTAPTPCFVVNLESRPGWRRRQCRRRSSRRLTSTRPTRTARTSTITPGTSTRTYFNTNAAHSINNTFNNTTLETDYNTQNQQAYQRLVGLCETLRSIVFNAKQLCTPSIPQQIDKTEHKNTPRKKSKIAIQVCFAVNLTSGRKKTNTATTNRGSRRRSSGRLIGTRTARTSARTSTIKPKIPSTVSSNDASITFQAIARPTPTVPPTCFVVNFASNPVVVTPSGGVIAVPPGGVIAVPPGGVIIVSLGGASRGTDEQQGYHKHHQPPYQQQDQQPQQQRRALLLISNPNLGIVVPLGDC
eukprot:CAMPEP_0168310726 /NCGR_PEP_ID=MMETSP0142_2-20121227/66983_1 /TAXON_ID=44445 /ORGANISM="Pseudo-nitzschia australis, Strain 10249 10 AB" /LENGTH=399 /DNA_ID=CAMNT_0008263569 /DNA_START=12 /DNA_END=1212 /DNA_ORIENTATION=-